VLHFKILKFYFSWFF